MCFVSNGIDFVFDIPPLSKSVFPCFIHSLSVCDLHWPRPRHALENAGLSWPEMHDDSANIQTQTKT